MARLVTIILLVTIPLMVFHILGIGVEGGSTYILDTLGLANPEDAADRMPIFAIAGILALGGGVAGIAAGAFFGRNFEAMLYGLGVGAMLGILTTALLDYIALYNIIRGVNESLALLIFSPLILVGGIFAIEWILKKD